MIIKAVLSQIEYEAYVMKGEDYKEGHPSFHPFVLYSRDKDYLVIKHDRNQLGDCHSILSPSLASRFLYIIIEATDEEKKRLRDSSYQMIGLT